MTILISPIGVTTGHVKNWLREVSVNAEKLWLIHSKKSEKHDFPKIAKDLVSDIKKSNTQIEIGLKVIDDALSIEPTYDAIVDIIKSEEEKNEEMAYKDSNIERLTRKDFLLNITGGTNVMGAATMIAATFMGTSAQYVLEPQPGDKKKKYVMDLPVKPIGTAKMNEAHKKVLSIIANNKYVIENTPVGIDPTPIEGRITRRELFEKMNWDKNKKNSTMDGITSKLEEDGMIKSTGYVEQYVLPNGKKLDADTKLNVSEKPPFVMYKEIYRGGSRQSKAPWPLEIQKNSRSTTFEITTLGKFTARNSMMF